MTQHVASFFLSWLANPRRVGAVAPSSDSLARLITSEITPSTGPIMELGPGTGAFTLKLLEKGVRPEDLTLIEYGSEFATILQHRFPGVRIVWMDAGKLASMNVAEEGSMGAIVSGLPLLTMPTKKVVSIVSGALRYLRPNGAFYQFTYGPRFPVSRRILDRLGLKATLVGRTMHNIPPAAVYRLVRRAPCRLVVNNGTPSQSGVHKPDSATSLG